MKRRSKKTLVVGIILATVIIGLVTWLATRETAEERAWRIRLEESAQRLDTMTDGVDKFVEEQKQRLDD